MPLADFLATAGRGTAIGQVAEAFGGKSPGQQRLDAFTQGELPGIVDALDRAQTRQEIEAAAKQLSMSWLKAGLPPNEQFDKFAERLTAPAINRVQQGDLESIRRDYGAQTTPLTPQVAPPGQGQPLGLDTVFAPQTTPARNPLADPEGALRVARALGANPAGYKQLLETQSEIENRQAETKQKATSAAKTERQLQDIEALKGGAPVTPGILGSLHPAGLVGAMEGRQLPGSLYGAVGTPQFQPELQKFLAENPNAKREDLTALMTQHNAALSGGRAAAAGERGAAAGERAATAAERAATVTQFNQADKLRDEFNAQSKDFRQVRDAFGRIRTSATSPTPAGDLSMLYNYMKMLDPGSVVRESEFRSAQTARPLLERLGLSWDAVSGLWAGQRMTPGMRQDFLNRSNQLYRTEEQTHKQREAEYKRLAESYGLNPRQIITEQGAPSPEGGGGAPKILKIERMP